MAVKKILTGIKSFRKLKEENKETMARINDYYDIGKPNWDPFKF